MAKASSRCQECRTKEPYARPKNGRTTHKKGYVMLRIPEHPRAKSNNGYVFEHILVMEESLGRLLVPGENVHHKNGIKDDNSLSNLELWNRPQPSGARAEDLYCWALNIVELYGDLFDAPTNTSD